MNKLLISYLFLALYVFAMFRPILPVIDYALNYDYIAERLCENKNKPILACYGKCYLAKEVQKTLPDSPIGENPRTPKIDSSKYPVTLLNTYNCHLFDEYISSVKIDTYSTAALQEYSFSILRPPQV